ncbi:hypothetical protein ABLV90_10065 [Staphylococcus sp. 2S1]
MTENPKKAYNHFAHLNDFLKKKTIIDIQLIQTIRTNGYLIHQKQIYIRNPRLQLNKKDILSNS